MMPPTYRRLKPGMTIGKCADVIREGNADALNIFGMVVANYSEDLDKARWIANVFRWLDNLEIYGGDVVRLYRGVAGQDIGLFIQLLNAAHLDLIDPQELVRYAKDGLPEGFNRQEYILKMARKIVEVCPDKAKTEQLGGMLKLIDLLEKKKKLTNPAKESV